jgi:hypothetical protein
MAVDIARGQRLLDPGDIQRPVESRTAKRLVNGERLVCIGKYLKIVPYRVTDRCNTRTIFVGPTAYLEL